jgi:hypothetical protein
MASVLFAGFSPIPIWGAGVQTVVNAVLDASGDKYAAVFMLREAATLTHAAIRVVSRTGTPPTYRVSLQGVDASGLPDAGILASQTFTPPADATWNTTIQWIQFAASYNAARGQVLALVVDYSSGTIDASNFSTFASHDSGWTPGRPNLPYAVTDTTGTWAKSLTGYPIFGVKSSTTVYGFPLLAVTSATVSVSGSRAAKKFTLPSGGGGTFKLAGARLSCQNAAAAQSWIVGLWDAAGAVIQAVTLDADIAATPANASRIFEVYFDDTPAVLDFGTAYYLGIERAASNVILYSVGLSDANDASAFPLGAASCLSTWNGSAWSDTTTSLPIVELIFEDLTASAGGGSTFFVVND